MANKQIKDYTNLPLADTDSLIKQSVTGLTSRTTLTDIKGNLDDRYTQKGTVIWEDEEGDRTIFITLPNNRLYEFWVYTIDTGRLNPTGYMIVRAYKQTENAGLAYFRTQYQGEVSDGVIYTADTAPTPNIVITKGYCYKIIDLGEVI